MSQWPKCNIHGAQKRLKRAEKSLLRSQCAFHPCRKNSAGADIVMHGLRLLWVNDAHVCQLLLFRICCTILHDRLIYDHGQ